MKNCSEMLKFIQFADDTTIMYSHSSIVQLKSTLETETNKVINWLRANKLIINLTKTHSMLFTKKIGNFNLHLQIQDIQLEENFETSFLGVIIDNRLSWKQHIQYISGKISKSIALMRLLRNKFPKRILKIIYMSLIYSYINYCNLIWGGAYKNNIDPLIKLQKKALRIVNNSTYFEHTEPIFRSLKLLNIFKVYKFNCVLFAYKCIKTDLFPQYKNRFVKNSSIHSYPTRTNNLYRPPSIRLDLCKNSFLYQSIVLWNSLGEEIRKYNSIDMFKKKVKAQFIESEI